MKVMFGKQKTLNNKHNLYDKQKAAEGKKGKNAFCFFGIARQIGADMR